MPFVLLCWGSLALSAEKEQALIIELKEPQIERLSSTRYRVTCDSGKSKTIVLNGAPDSSAAGPKNQYVLSVARQFCWQSVHSTK